MSVLNKYIEIFMDLNLVFRWKKSFSFFLSVYKLYNYTNCDKLYTINIQIVMKFNKKRWKDRIK